MIKKFIQTIKEFLREAYNNPVLSLYVISVVAIIIFAAYLLFSFGLYLYLEHWLPIYEFYESSLETHTSTEAQQEKESLKSLENLKLYDFFGQFARNSGWLVWMGISLFALLVTMFLTIWGRYTQDKQRRTQHASHLHDRYEKAANMLGSEIMAVRVAGCQALMSLGIDDEKMKVQCVRLLFSFIRNPYLETEDKGKKLDEVFPIDKALRDDIQEAANSFSEIYDKYENEGVDSQRVKLPDYFLKNKNKINISLIGANLIGIECQKASLLGMNLKKAKLDVARLQGANLQSTILQKASLYFANLREADLRHVRLQGANLNNSFLQEVKFQGANLRRVNLKGADISGAQMQGAKGLTKKQILSTKWGFDEEGKGTPSKLPAYLAHDPKMQDWLATPHYDYRKNKDS